MDLLIIRHGESEADILKVIEGRANFSLTDYGKKQAKLMASWVASYTHIDKIISSSLIRALQTAKILSEATGIPVISDDSIQEWGNGLIAGLTYEEAKEKYPEPIKYPHTSVYEQESLIDFRARAEAALSKIIHENSENSTIAVVSHGGMINMLFRAFLELPVKTNISISTGDTGIHHWRIKESERKIVFLNKLSHLDGLVNT